MKDLLIEEDYHWIDKQLHLEALCTLAFAYQKITIGEYECHRDEHLKEITTQVEIAVKRAEK